MLDKLAINFGRTVTVEGPDGKNYAFKGFGRKDSLKREAERRLKQFPRGSKEDILIPGTPVKRRSDTDTQHLPQYARLAGFDDALMYDDDAYRVNENGSVSRILPEGRHNNIWDVTTKPSRFRRVR